MSLPSEKPSTMDSSLTSPTTKTTLKRKSELDWPSTEPQRRKLDEPTSLDPETSTMDEALQTVDPHSQLSTAVPAKSLFPTIEEKLCKIEVSDTLFCVYSKGSDEQMQADLEQMRRRYLEIDVSDTIFWWYKAKGYD